MLKNFKPISLILLAGATCFPASIFAETMPSKQGYEHFPAERKSYRYCGR